VVRARQTLDGANADSLHQHPKDLRCLLWADVHPTKEILAGFPKGALAFGALKPFEALAVFPMGLTLQIAIRAVHVKSPVEFHSRKPDNGVEDSYGLRLCDSRPQSVFQH
jgi:hypothetical protein